jgi:hypothetical protein
MDNRGSFRLSFSVVFSWLLVFGVLLGWLCALVLLVSLEGKRFTFSNYLHAIFRASVWHLSSVAMIATAFSLCIRQAVTSGGVAAHTFWGVQRFTSWSDVMAIRPCSILGLKFLRLDSRSDGKTAWLSLFLSPKSEFRGTVLRLAPPDHPIRGYFA